jgi:hypothetical protein
MREPTQLSLYTDWYGLQLEWEANLLKTFLRATPAQIVEGKRWYPEAIKKLDEIRGGGFDIGRIAAICAVLSPRITWDTNVKGTRAIIRAVSQGLRVPPSIAGVRRNVDRAWEIANGASLELVSGPKVTSFYANLTGDFQRVTCDTWAARAAGIDDKHHNHLDRMRYKHLEIAYQVVARELEFAPAELQAICWIVVRGKGE